MKKRILVADGDPVFLNRLCETLRSETYDVLPAGHEDELFAGISQLPDLIILDSVMPESGGWEIVRRLKRDSGTKAIPIVFLASAASEADEIVSLDLGAADYIPKPVTPGKLLARLRALLRSNEISDKTPNPSEILSIDGLGINLPNYSITVDGQVRVFPKKEFEILAYLAERRGRVVTRHDLLGSVWGPDFEGDDRTINVHIRKIREKLGRYDYLIETVKKVGYRFKQ